MNMGRLFLYRVFILLLGLFCFAYPIAVIGVAFDVRPPFSLAWAGSALLFLEGTLLIVATMLIYGWLRGLYAGLIVITLSCLVETIGVNTSFPFGAYRYTNILFPSLPGGVPLAVMFAWVLIIFGAHGWVRLRKRTSGLVAALLGATLATMLDLEIEPVATHLEHYWQWLAPGRVSYYGVPLANFAAWFIVAFVLLLLVDAALPIRQTGLPILRTKFSPWASLYAPRLLFAASLLMFGLVDLTHGYYGASVVGLLAGVILCLVSALERNLKTAM